MILTCADDFDQRRFWPAPILTCADFVAPKCPGPFWWLITFGKAALSTESTKPIYCSNCKEKSNQSDQECWRKMFCFTLTIHLSTRLSLQCLLFVIVDLNWLNISPILLIWLPQAIISYPTCKKVVSGKRYQSNDVPYLLWRTILRARKKHFVTLNSYVKTLLEELCGPQGDNVEK